MPAMKQRWRLWWLAGAMVILVTLCAGWLGLFEPAPSISVSLMGYAKAPMMAGPYPGDTPWRPVLIPCALVQVTNTDNVPVQLSISIPAVALAEIAKQHDTITRDAAQTYFGSASPLIPAGSTVLSVPINSGNEPWQPKFNYVRIRPEWKLKGYLVEWLPRSARMWLRQLKPPEGERSVQLGLVTNLPPTVISK